MTALVAVLLFFLLILVGLGLFLRSEMKAEPTSAPALARLREQHSIQARALREIYANPDQAQLYIQIAWDEIDALERTQLEEK